MILRSFYPGDGFRQPEDIRATVPRTRVELQELDRASRASIRAAADAKDRSLQTRLWALSEELTGVTAPIASSPATSTGAAES
jgi:hypothetical protein